jgi:hypothetical protein
MREWTVLFTEGKPLFEPAPPVESTEPTPEQILEQDIAAISFIGGGNLSTCRIPQSLTNSVT